MLIYQNTTTRAGVISILFQKFSAHNTPWVAVNSPICPFSHFDSNKYSVCCSKRIVFRLPLFPFFFVGQNTHSRVFFSFFLVSPMTQKVHGTNAFGWLMTPVLETSSARCQLPAKKCQQLSPLWELKPLSWLSCFFVI